MDVGDLFRQWRHTRRKSQLALALDANVSARHVSFIESGRSRPSRQMVLALAGALDVPLRERNDLLVAAGYAPLYRETGWTAPHAAHVRDALERILRQQEPYPAVVMDRYWNLVTANEAAQRFFSLLLEPQNGTPASSPAERTASPPSAPVAARDAATSAAGTAAFSQQEESPNILRFMFDPAKIRPYVANWEAVAESLIQRVHREAVGGVPDPSTRKLLDELLSYPGVPKQWQTPDLESVASPVVPVAFRKGDLALTFFSTITTLGTPQDIRLQETRIECFFPADHATEERARQLAR